MFDTEKLIRVDLHHSSGEQFSQYIADDCHDSAIAKAKKTFQARLFLFAKAGEWIGSTTQRSCKLTPMRESWKFEFESGWVTRHNCADIFSEMRAASSDPFVNGPITGVYKD